MKEQDILVVNFPFNLTMISLEASHWKSAPSNRSPIRWFCCLTSGLTASLTRTREGDLHARAHESLAGPREHIPVLPGPRAGRSRRHTVRVPPIRSPRVARRSSGEKGPAGRGEIRKKQNVITLSERQDLNFKMIPYKR